MGGPSGRHRAAAAAAAGTLMLSLSRDDVVSPCVRSRTATGRRLGALNGVARIFSAAAKTRRGQALLSGFGNVLKDRSIEGILQYASRAQPWCN